MVSSAVTQLRPTLTGSMVLNLNTSPEDDTISTVTPLVKEVGGSTKWKTADSKVLLPAHIPLPQSTVIAVPAPSDIVTDGSAYSLARTNASPAIFSPLLPLSRTEVRVMFPMTLTFKYPQTFLNTRLLLLLTATIGFMCCATLFLR